MGVLMCMCGWDECVVGRCVELMILIMVVMIT